MEQVEGTGIATKIPYQHLMDAKRQRNLQKSDVCLLRYNGKIKSTFRICIVLEPIIRDEGLVQTTRVGYRLRRDCKDDQYKLFPLDELVAGVPRLVLIVPVEELPEAGVAPTSYYEWSAHNLLWLPPLSSDGVGGP